MSWKESTSIGAWLTSNKLFTVTFSDPSYCYLDGKLYRDNRLLADARLVAGMLETDWDLTRATSEKPDGSSRSVPGSDTSLV
ncbi:MAG: hypothetical protein IPK71_36970 [Myxococcales bacterium]|nr:hypothetical protein [Myxococcales bacterium]